MGPDLQRYMSRLPHLQVDRHRDTKTLTPKRYHVLQCVSKCDVGSLRTSWSITEGKGVLAKDDLICRPAFELLGPCVVDRDDSCCGYCATWLGLLDSFEVDLRARFLIRSDLCIVYLCVDVYCLFVRRDAQMGNECSKWRLSLHWLIVELIYWEQ